MRLFRIAVLLIGVFGEVEISRHTEIIMPKCKQEIHEGKKQYYRIIVTPNSPEFKCQAYITAKRFSEFDKLYQELKTNSPGHDLFSLWDDEFPRKHINPLASLTPDEVEERRDLLEKWLKKALLILVDKDSDKEAYSSDENLNNIMSFNLFFDPSNGEDACKTGIMIPADKFKTCGTTHFYGIHVQNPEEGVVLDDPCRQGNGYYVFHRFNQFKDLAKALGQSSWDLAGGVSFPWADVKDIIEWWKSIWGQQSLDGRRKKLEKWLQGVMMSPLGRGKWKKQLDEFLDPYAAKLAFYSCIGAIAGIDPADLVFDDTAGYRARLPDRSEL